MDKDKVKLRRYEDDLNVGGLGVAILGAWDVLKVIMHVMIEGKNEINLEGFAGEDMAIVVGVLIAIIAAILLIFLLIFKLHLYIGLNASKAARGEKYKKGYYKAAIILLVLSVIGMFAYIYELKDPKNIETTIASFIVDLTSVYVLWLVVSNTRKIRQINSLREQE
ncbi:MAG: hypothetical protein K6F28_10300 [Lachnospiraceae bacterium]|nr:hypothetical protein [Lachnospiraceae bacterium]